MQPHIGRPCPKIFTRHRDRRKKVRVEETSIDRIYREVEARDGNRCRACGRPTTTKPDMLRRREHNHLKKRSQSANAVKHTTANVFVIHAFCHLLLTAGKIKLIGRNADGPLAFTWTSLSTKAEREGIRLVDERPRPEWAAR